jgi:ATP-dependent Clp protease protease subunit
MNRLLALLASNRTIANRKFAVKAEGDSATVYLYDTIVSSKIEAEYWGGVAAETFVREFAAIKAGTIHLRINSPGGDVFAARAMEQAIKEHDAHVITHVDGYAASAASIIALAGDESEISEGGSLMIHKAWSLAMGNSDDFLATAALLEQVDNTLVQTYAKRTGLSADAIRALLTDETWLFAQEAVDGKWIDRIATDGSVEDKVQWNVDVLQKAEAQRQQTQQPTTASTRAQYERKQKHYERIAA